MKTVNIDSFDSIRQRAELLRDAKRIAIVGARAEPIFRSYVCAEKLLAYGFDIVPVSAVSLTVLGHSSCDRVAAIDGNVDIVLFFPDGTVDMPQAAQDAIAKSARAFWIENGAASESVRELLKPTAIALVEHANLQTEFEQMMVARVTAHRQTNKVPARHVAERMTRYPTTVTGHESIANALEKMQQGHFHHLPVVDDAGRLLGMFTDRDFRLQHPSPQSETDPQGLSKFLDTAVASVLTANPVSVLPEAPLEEAAELMLRWNIGALPVIAGDHHVIGILTLTDVIKEFILRGPPKIHPS